ncbi:hypothetical protein O181_100544 [Austropuccinia psidii MF-1]|uniref:Integrase catalytic domain-containing protein n=1 Tax=Austropuccinia psidii MF-1 TaxID=1389203 RepID=A0A9Q3JFF0_9BASI|nr:hypothetical protein [Austropuccinia psidii MF-1]
MESNQLTTIVLDTGASNYMFNNKSFFEKLYPNQQIKVATGCGKSTLKSQGKGLEKIIDRLGNLWLLQNSLYVPDLTDNLIVLSSIAKNKTRIKKTTSHFEVYPDNNNKPSFICPVTSNILETQVKLSSECCLNTQAKEDGDLWHKQLGHMNKNDMTKLVNTTEVISVCNECIKGKITQLPFKQSFKASNHLLENIHLALCGPFQTPSIGGAKYFLIIIDQMSGSISTKFLKNKSNCFNHFYNFKISAKNIFADGGGEFVNKSFKNLCTESGINHAISPPYTPQHNPFSERGNRSVLEKESCILLQSKLPMKYWSEAVSMATFLYLKSWDGIFLGYKNIASSYRIIRPIEQKIIVSRNVVFDKENFPLLPSQQQSAENVFKNFPNSTQIIEEEAQLHCNTEEGSSSTDPTSNEEEDTYVEALENQPSRIGIIGPQHPTLISSEINSNNILPYPQRQARANLESFNQVPKTFCKAMASPNKKEWNLAI